MDNQRIYTKSCSKPGEKTSRPVRSLRRSCRDTTTVLCRKIRVLAVCKPLVNWQTIEKDRTGAPEASDTLTICRGRLLSTPPPGG